MLIEVFEMEKIFAGIDIGTQGVRGVLVSESGRIVAHCLTEYPDINVASVEGHREQVPQQWWECVCSVLKVLTSVEKNIEAVTFDGTSGTIVPLDSNNLPYGNAIMYNDTRATLQVSKLSKEMRAFELEQGHKFHASYALPKIMWCEENGIKAAKYVHQVDYIIGMLTGDYSRTDYSNSLKTGYDLKKEKWPDEISAFIDIDKLPKVVPCGSIIGEVSASGAAATGLKLGTNVCAGATDGYTSALAACAVEPGDWASIIGTTMIIKGVAKECLHDSNGAVYCHKHPEGWWMPGSASNSGGYCLNVWFGKENLPNLNKQVQTSYPTGALIYPLIGKGERFPFRNEKFTSFSLKLREDAAIKEKYQAALEGIGYTERLCYERLASYGYAINNRIFTTGGLCKSHESLQIRSNILNRTLLVPEATDAAVGCAMLAASKCYYSNISDAVKHMGKIIKTVNPQPNSVEVYNEMFLLFEDEVKKRIGECE